MRVLARYRYRDFFETSGWRYAAFADRSAYVRFVETWKADMDIEEVDEAPIGVISYWEHL